MFSVKVRHLIYISEKILVRNLRNRRHIEVPNPGLSKRIDELSKHGIKIEDENVEDFVEDSNSDFHNVGEVYNEYVKETLSNKYEMRQKIVKEKYFKENMPNLLTWSEKEQIRHLATTYPDEWTPERIAESFPITAQIAKKLLKYPWKPASEDRIARHDASAMRNWKELKQGTLNIPEDLRQQFLKFSERTIPPLNKKSIKVDLTQEEKLGEFEQIIRRCSSKETSENDNSQNGEENETNIRENNIKLKKDTQRITLEELTSKIKKRLDSGKNVEMPDRIIIDTVNNDVQSVKSDNKEIELISHNPEEKGLSEYQENNNESNSVINYPERIRIPKKAYKKGATYKIKDCYYDHDGRFLYRVIGLSQ